MTSPSHIDIGNRLELFVDDHIIDQMAGTSLRLHEPRKMPLPQSPLTGAYITVIRDGDLYRAYFRRYKPGFTGERKDGNRGECTCYAESKDGIQWQEPNLDLLAEDVFGKVKNAILDESPFAHNLSPFLDQNPDAKDDERYKALAGTRESGLHAFTSADGIRWRRMSSGPVIPYNPDWHGKNAFDSQNVAFWSTAEKCYVSYFRYWNTKVGGPRSISRATSKDFLNWQDESLSFQPPNLEGEELYTSQTHPYFRAPHIYIALPTRFTKGYVMGQPVTNEEKTLLNQGSTDIMFMTSRAGTNAYQRTCREAFIRPGIEPAGWENRANYLALNVLPTGPEEMSIYNRSGHRYTLRTDGFVSINALYEGGELVTKPLIFTGNELILNLSTAIRGGIRVELQDENGRPLPGFNLNECETIIGDSIKHTVTWKGNSDVSKHAGKPVRLRFNLQDSDIFSMQFV